MLEPFTRSIWVGAAALATLTFTLGAGAAFYAPRLVDVDATTTSRFIEKVSQFSVVDTGFSTVFVGDSLTERGLWNELLPEARIANRGLGSATVPIIIGQLDHLPKSATAAFLLAGVNDVAKGRKADAIADDYRALIEWLNRRRIDVHVVSTLRTSTPSWNKEIDLLNQNLHRFCEARNCTFIDITEQTSRNGLISPNLTSDGIHLKGEGYRIWADAVKPFLNVKNGQIR